MKKNPWITAVLNFFFNGAGAITMDEQRLAIRLDQLCKGFLITRTGCMELDGFVWIYHDRILHHSSMLPAVYVFFSLPLASTLAQPSDIC